MQKIIIFAVFLLFIGLDAAPLKPDAPTMEIPDVINDDAVWTVARSEGGAQLLQDGEFSYFRLREQIPGEAVFLRSPVFAAHPGSYQLTLKARGSGSFKVGFNNDFRNPVFSAKIALDTEWREHTVKFEVPEPGNRTALNLLLEGKSVDFGGFAIAPLIPPSPPARGTLKNARIQIEFFDAAIGGGIRSIRNADGVEFINRAPTKSLWAIRMKKIHNDTSKLPKVIHRSSDPEQSDGSDYSSEFNADDKYFTAAEAVSAMDTAPRTELKNNVLTMYWDGISVGKEQKVLDAWAKAELKPDGTFCLFDGGFNNRSKEYTVYYFMLPTIDGLGAIHGKPAEDFLAIPHFNGRLIANPVEKNLLGKNKHFLANVGHHSMHFDALYNNGSGIYFSALDPDQYAKRFQLTTNPVNGLGWSLINVPNNMRQVPQVWEMPYQPAVRTFQGDWYDACMIYRYWALRQQWCEEGPVATRTSIPKWFKEMNDWIMVRNIHGAAQIKNIEQLRKDMPEYSLGAWMSFWGLNNKRFHDMNPDLLPLTEVDQQIMSSLHENDFKTMGYIQCVSWNNATASYKKHQGAVEKSLVRNYLGQALKWYSNPAKQLVPGAADLIAWPSPLWRQVLGDAVVGMAKAGFSAAYMDSANHGGIYLNFTPEYSGESGGGSGYVRQNQDLLLDLRKRTREIDPQFCLTSESFWEGNIAHIDGFLVCNTTSPYLEDERVSAIPMAQAVYHDYTVMYSTWLSNHDLSRDRGQGYVAKFAQIFCFGVKPSWTAIYILNSRKI